MMEVEPTGQHRCMATRSDLNVIQAEKNTSLIFRNLSERESHGYY